MAGSDSDNTHDGSSEERVDRQMIPVDRAAADAIALLRNNQNGVLCTISKRLAGWPFGSIAPYALDAEGAPILFISTIAEHTKNIAADDRVSLLVQESLSGDIQAKGRITVVGRAAQIVGDRVRDARARYLARVPSASSYSDAHDFSFYRIEPKEVRFIGGFGKIFWFDGEQMRIDRSKDPLFGPAKGIIDHMNKDHADALVLYCRAFKSLTPKTATMVGIDQFGFDVECTSPDVRVRFDFDQPAAPNSVRPIVVEMAKRAREILGIPAKSAT